MGFFAFWSAEVDDIGGRHTADGPRRWMGFSVMRSPGRGQFKAGRRIASLGTFDLTKAEHPMPWLREARTQREPAQG
jgi:hypothetical protein